MNAVTQALTVPGRNVAKSEATKVEQSRAIAEVQAAVVVAQQHPRSIAKAIEAMRETTAQMGLADNAFFKFSRAGSSVEGPSIHLATELARCWGNIDYCLKELSRDDEAKTSEMYAYAWDLETNARAGITFIVPHSRDTSSGPKPLRESRDIYENNANHGARRLREMIFRVLPKWFVEEAEANCRATLQRGNSDKPIAQQIADMLAAFEQIGISRDRIEAKVGSKADAFTPVDLANLRISFKSIKNKEIGADEEFPSTAGGKVADALAAPKETEKKPSKVVEKPGPMSLAEKLLLEIEAAPDAKALDKLMTERQPELAQLYTSDPEGGHPRVVNAAKAKGWIG